MIEKVLVGDTREYTWINSGAAPSPINHTLYLRDSNAPGSGTEIIVSSKSGVSSGNGHYFSLAQVSTPGYYVSEWNATLDSNLYKERIIFQATAKSIDRVGRYIDWGDVVGKYPQAGRSSVDAVQASSYHIAFAENMVDGLLAPNFSIPFSHTNLTVKELCIDAAFMKLGVMKDSGYEKIKEDFDARIKRLNSGMEFMIVSSTNGNISAVEKTVVAWSNTKDYSPTFNMLPIEYQEVSSSQLQVEYDDLN